MIKPSWNINKSAYQMALLSRLSTEVKLKYAVPILFWFEGEGIDSLKTLIQNEFHNTWQQFVSRYERLANKKLCKKLTPIDLRPRFG